MCNSVIHLDIHVLLNCLRSPLGALVTLLKLVSVSHSLTIPKCRAVARTYIQGGQAEVRGGGQANCKNSSMYIVLKIILKIVLSSNKI